MAHARSVGADSGRAVRFWLRNGPMRLGRVLAYLRPGFHPSQAQTDELARAWLGQVGL